MSWRLRAAERVLVAISQRGVGNTMAMLQGFDNVDSFAVFPTFKEARASCGENPQAISVEMLDAARGMKKPVLLDHSTVELLLRGLLEENKDLRERLAERER